MSTSWGTQPEAPQDIRHGSYYAEWNRQALTQEMAHLVRENAEQGERLMRKSLHILELEALLENEEPMTTRDLLASIQRWIDASGWRQVGTLMVGAAISAAFLYTYCYWAFAR